MALTGHTGQSFGFTLMKGVRFDVHGDANDGCGKVRLRVRLGLGLEANPNPNPNPNPKPNPNPDQGLSGGEITVQPLPACVGDGFAPVDNVVVGNVALYGATSGSAFFRGKARTRTRTPKPKPNPEPET